jgi:methylmalonyl-CoA epimerase
MKLADLAPEVLAEMTRPRRVEMVEGKLDHVGIAVRDFDATAALYGRLGLTVTMKQAFEDRGQVRGYLSDGTSQLELLQPLRDDTALAQFVAARGDQLHHLCFEVDDLERGIADLTAEGYALMPGSPWRGSRGHNAYLEPPAGSGLVVELIQKDR